MPQWSECGTKKIICAKTALISLLGAQLMHLRIYFRMKKKIVIMKVALGNGKVGRKFMVNGVFL